MQQWSGRADLDRLALGTEYDGTVVMVDASGRIAGRAGIPDTLEAVEADDIFLGVMDSRSVWVRPVERIEEDTFSWRETAVEWQQPVAAALALSHWHLREPLCESCGSATAPVDLGVRRRCAACGELQFVRTDPAVIVAVIDPSERLLLARQGVWPARRYSVVAGFVEPGESLEQACWREVKEETQVEITGVGYVASQPWPMPRSLMVGFVAGTDDAHVHVDGEELVDGAFYSRDEIRDMQNDGSIELPSSASLGRLLIDRWLADQLPTPGKY